MAAAAYVDKLGRRGGAQVVRVDLCEHLHVVRDELGAELCAAVEVERLLDVQRDLVVWTDEDHDGVRHPALVVPLPRRAVEAERVVHDGLDGGCARHHPKAADGLDHGLDQW